MKSLTYLKLTCEMLRKQKDYQQFCWYFRSTHNLESWLSKGHKKVGNKNLEQTVQSLKKTKMDPLSIQTSFGRKYDHPHWTDPVDIDTIDGTLAGGMFQRMTNMLAQFPGHRVYSQPARSNDCRRSRCSPREKTKGSFYLCPSARNDELVCAVLLKCGRKASYDLSGFQARHVVFPCGRKRLLPCESVLS